jgi:NAD(P)H-hydrate epimerase
MQDPIRLTRAQVREIDRRATEQYHVPGIVLMENAARGATDVAWEMLGQKPGACVAIFCGSGNNGGDGFAIARHLHNRGAQVLILHAGAGLKASTSEFETNARITHAMGIETHAIEDGDIYLWDGPDLVIDALLGTGATSPPRDRIKLGIEILVKECEAPMLAIDVPSGLDCDTGQPLGPACVRATRTVTFVAEKVGFANPASRQYTGDVTVADIGAPRELFEQVLRDVR